jgi:hypothetical protein
LITRAAVGTHTETRIVAAQTPLRFDGDHQVVPGCLTNAIVITRHSRGMWVAITAPELLGEVTPRSTLTTRGWYRIEAPADRVKAANWALVLL